MYWWKWYVSERLHARDWSRDYTPQDKQAEQVLADWYGGPAEARRVVQVADLVRAHAGSISWNAAVVRVR